MILLFKAVIVDDEALSIEYLKGLLKKFEDVEILETYLDGEEAFDEIVALAPNLIFLDIMMPQISGLELAESIRERLPQCNIIFVTGYKEFALEAFEIGVTDYIVKPIKMERLEKLLNNLKDKNTQPTVPNEYMVCSFKYFHFKKDGQEIKNVKWRTAKSKELFVYLMQNRGQVVRKDVLIELLWPDSKVSNAYDNLYGSIYHIRNTLESVGINIEIMNTVHGYELNLNDVKYDVDEWENGIDALEKVEDENLSYCKRIMELYTGDYLLEEPYIWKENEQERLRVLYLDKTRLFINYLMEKNAHTDAILLALHVQEIYPYMDYSYFTLMQLYDKYNDPYNVERQYNKLQAMLEEEFAVFPSEEISEWYQDWLEKRSIIKG